MLFEEGQFFCVGAAEGVVLRGSGLEELGAVDVVSGPAGMDLVGEGEGDFVFDAEFGPADFWNWDAAVSVELF